MPLYELLALGVPRLPKEEVARMIQRLGRAVYDRGGVITDVKSYGEQPLAYKIRGTSGKYDQVRSIAMGNGGAALWCILSLSFAFVLVRRGSPPSAPTPWNAHTPIQ